MTQSIYIVSASNKIILSNKSPSSVSHLNLRSPFYLYQLITYQLIFLECFITFLLASAEFKFAIIIDNNIDPFFRAETTVDCLS